MPYQPDAWPFYFGIVRVEPVFDLRMYRKWRIGWRVWFQNGSHWMLLTESGWRQVWSAVACDEHET